MRPRLAPRGKLAYQSGDCRRTPTQWHAQRGRTVARDYKGNSQSGTRPSCFSMNFMLKVPVFLGGFLSEPLANGREVNSV